MISEKGFGVDKLNTIKLPPAKTLIKGKENRVGGGVTPASYPISDIKDGGGVAVPIKIKLIHGNHCVGSLKDII